MMEYPPPPVEEVFIGEQRWNCEQGARSIGRWDSDSSLQGEAQCRPPRRPNKHRAELPDHSACCGCDEDPRWKDRSCNNSSTSCPLMPERRKSFMECDVDCLIRSKMFLRFHHSQSKALSFERPKIRAAYSA